jgi:acyl-CoA synthetase (AMP-forming)/AMP-acid ligase II/aryl carrier-like protein
MHSIYEIIRDRSAQHPEKTALYYPDSRPLTYSQLVEHISYIVQSLNSIGITRNDTVAVIMPNGAEMAAVCLGTMSCASCAPLNPEYRHAELEAMMRDLDARALIISKGASKSASAIAERLAIPTLEVDNTGNDTAGMFEFHTTAIQSPVPKPIIAETDDVTLLLHTSGTTYKPKIVPLTHRNIHATAVNLSHAISLDESDVCLNIMPMFHIGGLVDLLISPLYSGGSVVLSPAFSAEMIPGLIETYRPTWTQVVPTMLEDICEHFSDSPECLSMGGQLKYVRSVAAKLPTGLAQRFEETFHIPVIEVYGMTETTTLIATNPLPPGLRKSGSVGLPAGPDVAIMDELGNRLSRSVPGEVVVRGPTIMKGYRGVADNDSTFHGDWFRTGDFGYLDDDGYLFLTGRIKEVINRGGEKVDPGEIDDVIKSFPAIIDAACFGITHPTLGEDVAAALVISDDIELDEDAFKTHLSQRLAYFKVPRTLYLTDHIDKTQNGKVKRALLQGRFADLPAIQFDKHVSGASDVSELGEQLAKLWCTVLEIDSITATDNFFDLGGDSLKALTFLLELNEISGENVFVTALYDAPTLLQFETLLSTQHPNVCQRLLGQKVIQDINISRPRLDDIAFEQFGDAIPKLSFAGANHVATNPRAVFILCPPRSGSTLFRIMLAGNPGLFSPPELYLLNFDDLAQRKLQFSGAQRGHLEGLVRAIMQLRSMDAEQAKAMIDDLESRTTNTLEVYRMLKQWVGDKLLVEKTPFYCAYPEVLERMESCFDDPLYIHLSRHPYGMIKSFTEVRMDKFWYPRLHGEAYAAANPCPYDSSEFGELVWYTVHHNILNHLSTVPKDRQINVRFEDILENPAREMQKLCQFMGVDYDEGMLEPYAERSQRMTDGLHEISQMVGDVKFEQHGQIKTDTGDQWKSYYEIDFLNDLTWDVARELGHHETIASTRAREEIEII